MADTYTASEFTTNYNLDLYSDGDRPNLRDQYNNAMRKVDAQMFLNSGTSASALNAAAAAESKVNNVTSDIQTAQSDIATLKTNVDTINDNITTLQSGQTTNTNSINSLTSSLDTTNKNLNSLTSTVSNNTSNIKSLTANVTQNSSDIQAIQALPKNNNIYNSKFLAFGDSFTKSTEASKYWPEYLAEKTNSTYQNFAVGGTGFVTTKNSVNFLTQLQNAISTVTNKDEINYILVEGGFNDNGATESALQAAVTNFCTTAKTNFKNASIIVFPFFAGVYPLDSHDNDNGKSKLINPLIFGALMGGAIVAPTPWTWLTGYTQYNADGLHVNTQGQEVYANKILSFIQGGNPNQFRYEKLGNVSSGITSNVYASAVNGIITIRGQFSYSGGASMSQVQAITLPEWAQFTTYNSAANIPCATVQFGGLATETGCSVYVTKDSINIATGSTPNSFSVYINCSYPQGI